MKFGHGQFIIKPLFSMGWSSSISKLQRWLELGHGYIASSISLFTMCVFVYPRHRLNVDLTTGTTGSHLSESYTHDDVIKWKHFTRCWPFGRGIHRSPVNSPLKGQWRKALMFSLICAWINVWANNREAGDLGRHRAHYDVTAMQCLIILFNQLPFIGILLSSRRNLQQLIVKLVATRATSWKSLSVIIIVLATKVTWK